METLPRIKKIYYTVLAVVGVPVNLMAIVILNRRKCGLSSCTSRYLVAMATADFLVIVTSVILWRINSYYGLASFLDMTPVCSVLIVLVYATSECSVWFTVSFSFDRFLAICFHQLKAKFCTDKNAALILAAICILLCLKDVPFYFAIEPGEIIDNIPWFCNFKPIYYTNDAWIGFDWFDKILTPLLPYAFILFLNSLTTRYVFMASRARKELKGQSKREKHSDLEMESRRRSMILLFAISGNFILLWLLYVVDFFYYIITGISHEYYSDYSYIFAEVAIMLVDLSCCTNAFIYGVTQSKFREQFKSMLKFPFLSINLLVNKQKN